MRHLNIALLTLALGVSAFAGAPVPRPAKEFTFVENSGKQTLLSSYKGKVVVIQFLFTTCPHCQALSGELTKMMKDVPGAVILGVAFNEEANPATVDAYVRQYHVGFPVVVAPRDTVVNFLGISVMERLAVPQMAIIDKNGVIRRQSEPMGTAELQMPDKLIPMIKGYQAEPAGGSSAVPTKAPAAKPAAATPAKKAS
jgi:peroxiredoxin